MQMELVDDRTAKIKVVGVGGAGGNAVNRMVESGLDGVEFIAINTDSQALEHSRADVKIHIGKNTTKGLGAGANPQKANDSIQEDRSEVEAALIGADMVFITAGMGGGTGTGAAPIVAQICKELDILSVAVVTRPFPFEGPVRARNSAAGIAGINQNIDTLITIANEKILGIAERNMSFKDAFAYCDGVLANAVRGISEIILKHGEIQVDFADVKAVMKSGGQALMGTGKASGENRAVEAAQKAISSPLLDDIDIKGASGLLVHICADGNLGIHEMNEAMNFIYEAVGEDNAPNIIFGVNEKHDMGDELSITVIATGFGTQDMAPAAPVFEPKLSKPAVQPVAEPVVDNSTPVVEKQNEVELENIFQDVKHEQYSMPNNHSASNTNNYDAFEDQSEILREREEALSTPSYQRAENQIPSDLEEKVFQSPRQTSDYLHNNVEGENSSSNANQSSPRTQSLDYSSNDEEDYEVPAFLRNLKI